MNRTQTLTALSSTLRTLYIRREMQARRARRGYRASPMLQRCINRMQAEADRLESILDGA